ncbi:hypothetical protein ACS0TW_14230, partial [Klebsiella michiganensis]
MLSPALQGKYAIAMRSGHVREEAARTLPVMAYHSEIDVYQNNSAPGIFIARRAPSPMAGFSPQPFGG